MLEEELALVVELDMLDLDTPASSDEVIQILCDLTGCDRSDLSIAEDYKDDGRNGRYVVYVNDKSTADDLRSVFEQCMMSSDS